MARKFLYVIAGITVFVIGLMFVLRFWSEDLTELTFVPSATFEPQPAMATNAWERPEMWISRPGMKNDPAHYLPAGSPLPPEKPLPVAVFFIHPTSYIDRQAWNASLDDPTSRERAALFVKGMASPFNASAQIWAPRYRQAAIGAFLTDDPQADKAIDLAYGDVLAAFDVFARSVPAGEPIVLAGHSQGAFLLRRLLRDRIAGTPLAGRIAAAYVMGWPVSIEHDLPLMGLPACDGADQAGCVMSWLTVADPAETGQLVKAYLRRDGLDGESLGAMTSDGLEAKSPFLCTNPLTGTRDGKADADANLGTLVPDFKTGEGSLAPRAVPAWCADDHFLHIGPSPGLDLGPYVLPGNNYHLYDVTLFWGNLRADFERRVAAWHRQH
ncbi:hypothetical protein GCM10011494_08170 [Novosphingobium endophyticum]|uniref:DUF3089 domain-containing protein n=1 Tax=Novosphingobium endophyticum TaxID=1955250 RepID=A0A916TQ40_9SPHN|nr:DUF3089 domain-containing protein [Novosphingobium endophyticum]GGB92163.1 hypothetical protein GCM10011494_08170 [Novosphingobium endophyticum]